MGRGLERGLSLHRTAWALPGTLIGLLLGVASRGRWRIDDGTVIVESERGFARFLRRRGYRAITFGQVIVSHGALSDRLRSHERVHVWQWTRGGPVFALLYGAEAVRCLLLRRPVYRDNVFERQARALERG